MQNRPVYPIGIVSELLDAHPETLRVWERHGLVRPQRRGSKRFYSDNDLKRLQFIQRLQKKGLMLRAISYFLQLYPCWHKDDCPVCMHRSESTSCAKPCWREEGTYCVVSSDEDLCTSCQYRRQEGWPGGTAVNAEE
jgi:hypothetical protein